jgi:hypothetical protein
MEGNLKQNKIITKFPLAPMGVLAPSSAHNRRSAPIDTNEKKFIASVCKVAFKHLPQPLRSHIQSFGTLGQLLKIPPFCTQKSHSAHKSHSAKVGILIFLLVRDPCNISKPYENPFWEKINSCGN